MTWIARWRAQCLVTFSLLLLGGVAGAEPRTDLSQLDLPSARQTVTVSGLEVAVLPSLGHGNGTGILAGLRLVRFIGGGAFAGPLVGLSWAAA
jgi:hypothetical protein